MSNLAAALVLLVAGSTAASDRAPESVRMPGALLSSLVIDYADGPGYVVQNVNRYGATGTEYEADAVGLDRNLFMALRVSMEAVLGDRHTVVLLYAPLDLKTRATLPDTIDFRGVVFNGGEAVDPRYLFDGYRASYLYRPLMGELFQWDIGASLQVRNAAVSLSTVGGTSPRFSVESDIGVVPALKTRLFLTPSSRWWLMLDADFSSTFGLIGDTSGALYDVALTFGVPLRRGLDGFARLRWLGGGADVPDQEIENWADFAFATFGIRADLVTIFRGAEGG